MAVCPVYENQEGPFAPPDARDIHRCTGPERVIGSDLLREAKLLSRLLLRRLLGPTEPATNPASYSAEQQWP